MKNILVVSVAAALSVVGLVGCTVNTPPSTPDEARGDDSEKSASNQTDGTTAADSTTNSDTKTPADTTTTDRTTATDDTGACGTLIGSCKLTTVCNEYRSSVKPTVSQQDMCEKSNGTWSEEPCDLTEAVGGCKQETRTAGYCGSGTSWMFAPVEAEDISKACPAPGVVLTVEDAEK